MAKLLFCKKWSTDVGFPKRGRQIFVAVNMPPPVSKFLNTPLDRDIVTLIAIAFILIDIAVVVLINLY
jgi:hypothetical protein